MYKQVKVQVAQSFPTLCDPMDCTVHGILQARTLGGYPFPPSGDLPNPGSNPGLLRCRRREFHSLPLPQGKPKYTGVGSLIPSPADLPNPGIELASPALQVDSLPTELSGKPQVSNKDIQLYTYVCSFSDYFPL